MVAEKSPALAPCANGKPLVTVVVTAYNRVAYLKRAVRSALSQTHDEVQVVVVDDGSSVDLAPILDEFRARVELVRKSNGGLASARNFGIARAKGEFLLFLDDDDFLQPTAVEALLRGLDDSGAAWVAGRFAYVNEADERLPREHRCRYGAGDIYARMIFENVIGAPSAVMVRKGALRLAGGFDETFLLSEDWDLWLTLAREFPIARVHEVVSNYRIHSQQVSQAQWARHYDYHLRVLEKHRRRARPDCTRLFQQSIARLYLSYGDDLYVQGVRSEARRQWRQAWRRDHELRWRALPWRFVKSCLPAPVLSLGRRACRLWRARRGSGACGAVPA
jgi:glycosyltransferase involved in cell wall biosynthesis